MHFFAILTSGLICLFGAAYSNITQFVKGSHLTRVVGGQEAKPFDVNSIQFPLPISFFECYSSLITDEYILTAAYCGETSHEFTFQKNFPKEISDFDAIVHPSFDPINLDNDIALLRLASPIKNFTSFVKLPTNLAVNRIKQATGKKSSVDERQRAEKSAALRIFNDYTNQLAVITGRGTISKDGIRSISETLLNATVKIVDNSICANQFPGQFVADRQLCAVAMNDNTCLGDKGSPIFVNGVLAGILSYGSYCANPKHVVYTRISAYLDWIEKTIAEKHPTFGVEN